MDRNFADDLARLSPNASKAIIAGIVENIHLLDAAGINTPIRLRHFFARVCVETGGLHTLEENLHYSAQRVHEVWPSRFPTTASAVPYAGSPEKLANKVYGGRLGNTAPSDGWDYRGSGLLQNTGKANFAEVEKATGLPVVANPQLLRTFPGALQAATIYWKNRNINELADKNNTTGVCSAVNGGFTGLADQLVWLSKAAKIWPDGSQIIFPTPTIPSPAPQVAPPAPPVTAQEPSIPAAPQPEKPPVVTAPAPPPPRVNKPAAAASGLVLLAAAVAGYWHHITAFVSNLF